MTPLQKKLPILFLHGFTGSSADWTMVCRELENRYYPLAVDLVGHGQNEPTQNIAAYSIDAQAERLIEVMDSLSIDRFILTGYSMGGRIALRCALLYPQRISGLILESTTAGIEDAGHRQERIKSDEELAEFIETNDIETFVDRWMNLPLFASQSRMPQELRKAIREEKLKNSKIALTHTLRAAGTGRMMNMWGELNKLTVPVLLITGSIDKKFTEINERMSKLIPDCRHIIVEDSGHNVHLEKQEQFCKIIEDFISYELE